MESDNELHVTCIYVKSQILVFVYIVDLPIQILKRRNIDEKTIKNAGDIYFFHKKDCITFIYTLS